MKIVHANMSMVKKSGLDDVGGTVGLGWRFRSRVGSTVQS
jgi:hypothetical protein